MTQQEKETYTMGSAMSSYTAVLADNLCGGSSRKLIAGWWYSILTVTGVLTIMSFAVTGTRSISEGFISIWSAIMLMALSIGGTMIMRKFHNSMAVGFFMGGVVAMSQLFFFLCLLYLGYAQDQSLSGQSSKQEVLMSLLCVLQSILLGSFAAILGAHRSEILEKPGDVGMAASNDNSDTYEPPRSS